MAISSTYYLNGPSLGSATAVFTNAALTVCAANGFYSDGVIVREQVSCVLVPQQTCLSCSILCGGTISASGNQGVYYLNINLGATTGAVIVEFEPLSVPDGISALFNSVIYNGLSSPLFGWRQGTASLPTYVGDTTFDCGIVAGSPYTLNEFQYNGTTFAPLGTTENVSVAAGQMQLTASAPGNCVMVIPKTAASPSILNLTFIGPCSGTAFNVSVLCPAALTSFSSSTINVSSAAACSATINQTYYVAHVNGAGGTLGLYDLVFSDVNGQFKLNAGYYQTNDAGTNEWYQVDANGVIILFGDCLYSQFIIYFDVTTSPNTYGWGSSAAACLGNGTPLPVYINGLAADLNDIFSQGLALYMDVLYVTPLNGNNTWYKTVSAPASGDSFQVDAVGFISTYGGPC